MEDEGWEDLQGVSERGPEMFLAGVVVMGQGLPPVQCPKGQVCRGGAGAIGGWAFKEVEGGHGQGEGKGKGGEGNKV